MNPDVTRLLSILAQTASQAPQQQPSQLPFPPKIPVSDPRLLHGQQAQQYQPESVPVPVPVPAPVPSVDPRNVTDWPTALKYVMHTLGKDEAVMAKIKKMKKEQHDHEKQWWASREEMVKKHKARAESSQKVQDLLRKLGTVPPSQLGNNLPTPESEKKELRAFDQKVHLCSEDMVKHMTAEFGQMGIPFFCRSSLPGKEDSELQALRKRIVELLEDLCEGD